MKRVLVFGTFDRLHPGHKDFFRQARALGDELHVVVARDKTVDEVKHHLPTENEETRLAHVLEQPGVTGARLGYPDDKYRVIEEIKPDIIALGYDQVAFVSSLRQELARRGMQVDIVRLKPFHPEKYKSSKIDKSTTI